MVPSPNPTTASALATKHVSFVCGRSHMLRSWTDPPTVEEMERVDGSSEERGMLSTGRGGGAAIYRGVRAMLLRRRSPDLDAGEGKVNAGSPRVIGRAIAWGLGFGAGRN